MNILDFASKNNITETNSVEIIKTFLIKDYGYLSPKINNFKEVELRDLTIDDLYLNELYLDSLLKEDLSKYEPICEVPVIAFHRSNLCLIDGYHRLALHIQKGQKIIKAYVLK